MAWSGGGHTFLSTGVCAGSVSVCEGGPGRRSDCDGHARPTSGAWSLTAVLRRTYIAERVVGVVGARPGKDPSGKTFLRES